MPALDAIAAYHPLSPQLATSGQPTAAQFADIAAAGFTDIINLALVTSSNAITNEAEIVAGLGMAYHHLPVSWDSPQVSDVHQFFALMTALADRPVWVHCALNMRVSCFMYLYRLLVLGLSEAEARYPMSFIWQPDSAWQALVESVKAAGWPPAAAG